jgi:hypothetical protein
MIRTDNESHGDDNESHGDDNESHGVRISAIH